MTPAGHCRLILTRHAKSDWNDPSLDDHDRPLNARGRRSALELGDWLASRGYEPEQVLCSTSLRTRETWDGVARAVLEVMPEVDYIPALYHAEPDVMMAELKKARAPTVMMIGHNPGIAEFAAMLPAHPPHDPDFHRYPTAATLVVDFHADDWSKIRPGEGSVRDFGRHDGHG